MGMFDYSDPEIALAAGLLSGRGNLGGIMGRSLMDAQRAYLTTSEDKRRNQHAEQQAQQMRMMLEQQEALKQQRLKQEQFRASIPAPSALGGVDWQSGQLGPTNERVSQVKPLDPTQLLQHGAMRAGFGDPMDYINSLKPPAPFKLGKDDRLLKPGTWEELVGAAPEKPKPTNHIQDYEYAKLGGYQGSFNDWLIAQKKAGATSVSMSTGQKGFQNEMDLKRDFRAEPAYKSYQSIGAAYKSIKAGISADNPVGDLAAATKIMKLLDEDSVVRESELGMAMAAAGRMDRMKNLYDQHVKGRKLTDQQREEFGNLADELYEAAGQTYNQKYSEYEGVGKRYQLDTSGLGAKHKSIKAAKAIRAQADAILGDGK
jgi:hypothetical protein